MGRDPAMRAALRGLLAADGCTVVEALDAAAVAGMASLASVLVAVARAPDDDVVGELSVLRQLGYSAPAIVVARGATFRLRQRAFALGVVDVIGFIAGTADVQARLRAVVDYPDLRQGRGGAIPTVIPLLPPI